MYILIQEETWILNTNWIYMVICMYLCAYNIEASLKCILEIELNAPYLPLLDLEVLCVPYSNQSLFWAGNS